MARRQFQRAPALPPTNAAQLWLPIVDPSSYVRPVAQPNLIMNGRLDIWQRGTSFAAITSLALCDRFRFQLTSTTSPAAVMTVSQSSDVPSYLQVGAQLNYSMQCKVTVPGNATLAATDFCRYYHGFEGFDIYQFAGQPLTLSFWVKSTIAGTYCVMFANGNSTLYNVMEYQVINANVWEKKTITVVLPPFMSGFTATTGLGFYVQFTIAGGSTYTAATPNVWQTANQMATANQINTIISTVGATFQLAGIKLEQGVIATPLPYSPNEQELGKCQRFAYALTGYPNAGGSSGLQGVGVKGFANQQNSQAWPFPVSMRAVPTLLQYASPTSQSQPGYNAGAPSATQYGIFDWANARYFTPTTTVTLALYSTTTQHCQLSATASTSWDGTLAATTLWQFGNTAILVLDAEF